MRQTLAILIILTSSQTAQADDDVPQKEEPIWIDTTMEEMVTPLKQLFEYKEQAQPTAPKRQQTMRQAIRMAIKQYPGMVLSVKQETTEYRVKILSKNGVVKLIKIPAILPEDSQ